MKFAQHVICSRIFVIFIHVLERIFCFTLGILRFLFSTFSLLLLLSSLNSSSHCPLFPFGVCIFSLTRFFSRTTETYCPDAIGHVLATHIGKRTRILDGSFTYVELMKHYSSSLDDPDWQKENLLVFSGVFFLLRFLWVLVFVVMLHFGFFEEFSDLVWFLGFIFLMSKIHHVKL